MDLINMNKAVDNLGTTNHGSIVESHNTEPAAAIDASTGSVELVDRSSPSLGTITGTLGQAGPARTHILTFLGNGVWRDQMGEMWSKKERKDIGIVSERRYTDAEYTSRKDLQFMASYGEMKEQIV